MEPGKMQYRTIRVRVDETEDGKPVVSLVMGNMRSVGVINEVAWAEIPPGMAREIARDLIEAADAVELTFEHVWDTEDAKA
jgi:hypothetical protein